MNGGAFLSVLGIAAAVYYAIAEYTEGLLLVIAILFVVATKGVTTLRNQPGVRRRRGSEWETLHTDGPRGLL